MDVVIIRNRELVAFRNHSFHKDGRNNNIYICSSSNCNARIRVLENGDVEEIGEHHDLQINNLVEINLLEQRLIHEARTTPIPLTQIYNDAFYE